MSSHKKSSWQIYINSADKAMDDGRLEAAQDSLTAAMAEAEYSSSVEEPYLAVTLDKLSELAALKGANEEAAQYALRALRAKEHSHAFGKSCVIKALIRLSKIYYAQGKLAAAALTTKRALFMTEETLGLSHPAVGLVSSQLSQLYMELGSNREAMELNQRCLPMPVYAA